MKVFLISALHQNHYHDNCLREGAKIACKDENDKERFVTSLQELARIMLSASSSERVSSGRDTLALAYFMDSSESPAGVKTVCIFETHAEFTAAMQRQKRIKLIQNVAQTMRMMQVMSQEKHDLVMQDLQSTQDLYVIQPAKSKSLSTKFVSSAWYHKLSQYSCLSCLFPAQPLDNQMMESLIAGNLGDEYDPVDEADDYRTDGTCSESEMSGVRGKSDVSESYHFNPFKMD